MYINRLNIWTHGRTKLKRERSPPQIIRILIANPDTPTQLRHCLQIRRLSGLAHRVRIPSPLPLRVAKTGRTHLNEEFIPLLPTGIGEPREILAKPYQFRTCSALAPMLTPPINESAELTRGALLLTLYSEVLP